MKVTNSTAPLAESALHLRDYWRIVWDSRWTVLAVSILVFAIVAVTTLLSAPVYRAEATVDIQARAKRIAPVADVTSPGLTDYSWFGEERYFNTQFEIIKSRAVAEQVIEKLDLRNHPSFAATTDPVASFIRIVKVEPVSGTGIVRVSMEGTDPKEITRWVNAVVEAYVERNLEQAIADTRRAVNALLHELDPLRARLQETEAARFDFAQKTNLYVPEDYQKSINERLKQLEAQHTEARVKRLELEAVFNKIEELPRAGGSFLSLPQVNNHPTIRSLNDDYIRLEKELNRLLVSFKPSHPKVNEKRVELSNLRQKIDEQSNEIISGIRTEYALNRDRETNLAREIARAKEESLQTSHKAASYETLATDATETRRLFELFNTRVKEISLNTELMSNNIRILDRAVVPKAPVRPKRLLNLMVGALLGLGLGVGLAFFLDYLDNTIKTSEDVEQVLNLNTLAVIPRIVEQTENATREALQTLRTSLLFSSRNRTDRAILLTSTGPREGKTTTTISLARALAAAGDRVCIIDCDLRRPALHEYLSIRRQRGLTNYLMSENETGWPEYMKPTSIANVYAITSGVIPPNPPQIVGGDRFLRLVQTLKSNYDWVLLDSPPVGSLTDSIILASVVDMAILIIRSQCMDRDVIRKALASLQNVNANVVGVVLNDVDPTLSHYRSYYDYSYYLEDRLETSAEKEDTEGSTPAETGIDAGWGKSPRPIGDPHR